MQFGTREVCHRHPLHRMPCVFCGLEVQIGTLRRVFAVLGAATVLNEFIRWVGEAGTDQDYIARLKSDLEAALANYERRNECPPQ
jgi:hypothetical protein